MQMDLTFGGAVLALSYTAALAAAVAGPAWLRRRRAEAARLQILLTEAVDGALGPLVAPVVRRPLIGPWRIEIAAPLGRPGLVGRILAAAHAALAAAGGPPPGSYRIVLAPRPGAGRRAGRSGRAQWAGGSAAA